MPPESDHGQGISSYFSSPAIHCWPVEVLVATTTPPTSWALTQILLLEPGMSWVEISSKAIFYKMFKNRHTDDPQLPMNGWMDGSRCLLSGFMMNLHLYLLCWSRNSLPNASPSFPEEDLESEWILTWIRRWNWFSATQSKYAKQ